MARYARKPVSGLALHPEEAAAMKDSLGRLLSDWMSDNGICSLDGIILVGYDLASIQPGSIKIHIEKT